jgi:2,3-bisphosphoglycerate-independent phosphoglycerate mutase
MKYIILLGDGMADYPIEKLGGKTPLEAAHTPNMDKIASEGTLGLIDTIPDGFTPGSDVAIMTLLGYEAKKYFTGRGPLEAANMGVHLDWDDIAFRCNLVTVEGSNEALMEDFTAGHISSQEAKDIVATLNHELGNEEFQFYPGVGYRHLMVWKHGIKDIVTTPPHDITAKPIASHLPSGHGSDKILDLMARSKGVLQDHPVNKKRLSKNMKPANMIWLWGQGSAPKLIKYSEKYDLRGGMISAVDLLNGIGIYAGLKVIRVEGATGYIDTNYLGKANEAITALNDLDYIVVHVEAPDEMGHEGNLEGKIQAIEHFDEKIVGTILKSLHHFKDFRVMILSDHPTPVALKTHTSDPSPCIVFSSNREENMCNGTVFGESAAKKTGIFFSPGHLFMDIFIKTWGDYIANFRR